MPGGGQQNPSGEGAGPGGQGPVGPPDAPGAGNGGPKAEAAGWAVPPPSGPGEPFRWVLCERRWEWEVFKIQGRVTTEGILGDLGALSKWL